jgi:hypothetical protein
LFVQQNYRQPDKTDRRTMAHDGSRGTALRLQRDA